MCCQKKKKVRPSSIAEEIADTVKWSNADIEFPSTSTSDEIEIISQPDDETICKILSELPLANKIVQKPCDDRSNSNGDQREQQSMTTDVLIVPESSSIVSGKF